MIILGGIGNTCLVGSLFTWEERNYSEYKGKVQNHDREKTVAYLKGCINSSYIS